MTTEPTLSQLSWPEKLQQRILPKEGTMISWTVQLIDICSTPNKEGTSFALKGLKAIASRIAVIVLPLFAVITIPQLGVTLLCHVILLVVGQEHHSLSNISVDLCKSIAAIFVSVFLIPPGLWNPSIYKIPEKSKDKPHEKEIQSAPQLNILDKLSALTRNNFDTISGLFESPLFQGIKFTRHEQNREQITAAHLFSWKGINFTERQASKTETELKKEDGESYRSPLTEFSCTKDPKMPQITDIDSLIYSDGMLTLHLNYQDIENKEVVTRILSSPHEIDVLSIQSTDTIEFPKNSPVVSEIKTLRLNNCTIPVETLQKIRECFPNIHCFDLRGSNITGGFNELDALRKNLIIVTDTDNNAQAKLDDLNHSLLEAIKNYVANENADELIGEFSDPKSPLTYCPATSFVTHLGFLKGLPIDDETLSRIIERIQPLFPSVNSFRLAKCSELTADSLSSLRKLHLKTLDLRGCEKLFPAPRKLSLISFRNDASGLALVKFISSLQALIQSGTNHIDIQLMTGMETFLEANIHPIIDEQPGFLKLYYSKISSGKIEECIYPKSHKS
ncbi:MAG: hypothetical protein K940chlam7_00963 [Chlamydiae bacterium]|nr:hypothetical protein [Chlamydiota bacterium]